MSKFIALAGAAAVVAVADRRRSPSACPGLGGIGGTTPIRLAEPEPEPQPDTFADDRVSLAERHPHRHVRSGRRTRSSPLRLHHRPPADWEVEPATRDWTFDAEASADDWSPAEEAFVNRAGAGIRVTAWSRRRSNSHAGRMGRRRGLGPASTASGPATARAPASTNERCRSAWSGRTVIRDCSWRSRTMSRRSSPTSMARR